jgi:HD-like signal output (HDOD) protein
MFSGEHEKEGQADETGGMLHEMRHEIIGDMLKHLWSLPNKFLNEILNNKQTFLSSRPVIKMSIVQQIAILTDGLNEHRRNVSRSR